MQRQRSKQAETLEQRLANEAKRLRKEAELLPPGAVCVMQCSKARQAETVAQLLQAALCGKQVTFGHH